MKLLMVIAHDFFNNGFAIRFALHDKEGEQDFVGLTLKRTSDYYMPFFAGELSKDDIEKIVMFLGVALEAMEK